MPEDWVEKLIREYQDQITRGAYEGIWRLDAQARDEVMRAQAKSCVEAFAKLYAVEPDLGLDAFLEKMTMGGSSKIKIERDGDRILWEEQHNGECMCPMVKRRVIDLKPELCACAVHWLRMLVERHTRRQVRVELLGSVASGSQNCSFTITLGK